MIAGDTAFLLVERDDTEEHVSSPPDDRPPRIVEIVPSGDGMVERSLPAVSGKDLSAPSAIQLPDGGWLFVGVGCPPDPDALSPSCRGPSPRPIVRRLDPDDRTWVDVGTVPDELAGGTPELVGIDGDAAVLRSAHGEDSTDSIYWTVDLDSESYRELWRTPAEAAAWVFSRNDCAAAGRLVVVDEADGAVRQEISLIELSTGEVLVAGKLDIDSSPVAQIVCDEDGATLVGADRRGGTPVAYPLHDDGTAGPGKLARKDPDLVDIRSNSHSVVFVGQAVSDPTATTSVRSGSTVTEPSPRPGDETLRLTIFNGGAWHRTTVSGQAIHFLHPDQTGERVLLEHRDDRWTLAAVG